jgi:hypothetical protein
LHEAKELRELIKAGFIVNMECTRT